VASMAPWACCSLPSPSCLPPYPSTHPTPLRHP